MHLERRASQPAPFAQTVTPTSVVPAAERHLAPVPPPGMRVVGYVRIDGVLHPQYGAAYEPVAPETAPGPAGLDPQAQRTAARGVLAAGVGVGAYFGMQALQILVDSLVRLLAMLAVAGAAWVLQGGRRTGREGSTYVTNNYGFLAGWRSHNGHRK